MTPPLLIAPPPTQKPLAGISHVLHDCLGGNGGAAGGTGGGARDKQLEADLGAARALHAIHALSLSLSLSD